MPTRARTALLGAAAGVLLLVVTWWLSHDVAAVRNADSDILGGFVALQRPRLDRLTNAIAHLCNPMPYMLWAAIPVIVALLRGRPRLAITLAIVLLGANETTELLKPLAAGVRAPLPTGAYVTNASWPSGHATASMTLALCAVVCSPSRWRPAVGAAMAAFSVAVVFSFLELGWHYPSDAVGGFLVASVWTLVGVSGLWTYEAHRPALAHATAAGRPAFSVARVLAPTVVIIGAAMLFAALIALARPHAVTGYAHAHLTFVVGAAAIAAAAFALASALNLLMRAGTLSPVNGDLTPTVR